MDAAATGGGDVLESFYEVPRAGIAEILRADNGLGRSAAINAGWPASAGR